MKILWFLAFLHAALTQASFGRSYLGNSRLCQQWACLNTKLGLPDALPDKNQFHVVVNSLLPEGAWQNLTQKVVDTCYGQRPRVYTSTCPGQGLLFCAIDQLIQNCPDDSLRKDDACAPLTSLAGFKYLFTQSRYKNLEKNLPTERRPSWFLKNYFSSKCCVLPDLFILSHLNECGFNGLINYYDHPARPAYQFSTSTPQTSTNSNENQLKIIGLNEMKKSHAYSLLTGSRLITVKIIISAERRCLLECGVKDMVYKSQLEAKNEVQATGRHRQTQLATELLTKIKFEAFSKDFHNYRSLELTYCLQIQGYETLNKFLQINKKTTFTTDTTKKVKGSEYAGYQSIDPLDCCDMDEFIQPKWRTDCDFHLNWSIPSRLLIKDVTKPADETSTPKPKVSDVKLVPLSCEKETCVFSKIGIISQSGSVDVDAFSKLLDNVTDFHPDWSKAKARAVTTCLARPIRDYSEECEINKVLACTMDVLSENCPHAKKTDSCKRSKVPQDGVTCQISASKYRPKNRRLFCGIPNLVSHKVLSECGVNSISRMEYVSFTEPSKKKSWLNIRETCKESDSTKCVLDKMGALNRYGFMDYFKMKDMIRNFTSQEVWAALSDVYLNAFSSQPFYYGYCHTSKKLLNVLDFMLSTCPMSKRKHTHQCNKIFTEMATTSPITHIDKNNLAQIWRHFQHVFLPHGPSDITHLQRNISNYSFKPHSAKITSKNDNIIEVYRKFLETKSAPAVRTMAIKPQVISRKPLVLLPVYLRSNGKGVGSLSIRPYNNGVLRTDPFELHNKIVAVHASTTEANSDVIDPK